MIANKYNTTRRENKQLQIGKFENELKNDTIALKKVMKWAKKLTLRIEKTTIELKKIQSINLPVYLEETTQQDSSNKQMTISSVDVDKNSYSNQFKNSIQTNLDSNKTKYVKSRSTINISNKLTRIDSTQMSNHHNDSSPNRRSYKTKSNKCTRACDSCRIEQNDPVQTFSTDQIEERVRQEINRKMSELGTKWNDLELKINGCEKVISKNAVVIFSLQDDMESILKNLTNIKKETETNQVEINENLTTMLNLFKTYYK